jgi:hypothetical protein
MPRQTCGHDKHRLRGRDQDSIPRRVDRLHSTLRRSDIGPVFSLFDALQCGANLFLKIMRSVVSVMSGNQDESGKFGMYKFAVTSFTALYVHESGGC